MGNEQAAERPEKQAHETRKHLIRAALLVGWGLVLAVQISATMAKPTTSNLIVSAAFCLLFLIVNINLFVLGWLGSRSWRRVSTKLHGAAYLSEFHNLPNRNYVLAELRREMPRARTHNAPFVLIQLSLENIDGVRERRGDDFADRAVNGLVEVLKRLTRSSDFLAHLGGARFCVMLVECTLEQSYIYLKRVPGTISVSDGRQMLDVAVTARVHQYDLESLYATDVLRDLEETKPLRRREQPRMDALAA
ncbi:MAG TPA: diguanylate cyclase [Tepidiformaceae bacterium]|nr:diguanylate cyclase [Tepidiformaceae bacterium]HNO65284.1 diguanylate cyclase [Tepidiformaceae bacterium]